MKQLILTLMLSTTPLVSQAALLYSNGPVVDGSGLSVLAPTANVLGFGAQTINANAVADDFSIAVGESWTITDLDFFGYQTSASAFTFESVNWSIVSGDVNTGTVIASDTSLVTNGGLQGYRVSSDTSATNRGIFLANADIDDLFLGAGDYWLRWSLTGSDSFSGPWVPVVSDARTGNAQQSIAGGLFDTLTDSGNQLTVELPFSVNGSATTNEVSSPSVLAIFGLGLLSLAGARRRRKAA
ncbi:MAG: PEP-CTERM sorting domain-containing protein [Oceanospirillaceae bacterium]|jgi:MYXO-CTERM domain-containing protein|nr:PEP-CTERM sorting domain-containing protein [Oceanospirillaceae bacterium]HAU91966.1 PEP-CTERM sorting domain-containing protein [Alteromonas sp.]|tara:strand:+ start:3244 stop:3966 length:723 start_codon:yes stop_codon:yes gene_type:complete